MEYIYKHKGLLAIITIAVILLLFNNFTPMSDEAEDNTINISNAEEGTFDRSQFSLSNEENPVVVLTTTLGEIVLELYTDQTPSTANNFLKLTREGFYTDTKFHRVIDNFMIQGGDPNTKGNDTSLYGRGGPGYTIEDEFVEGLSNLRGTISMANTGQTNTGGSQFFINFTDNVRLDFNKEPLASRHAVFGNVVGGIDVLNAIIKVPTQAGDIPITPVVITNVTIYESSAENEAL